MTVASRPEVSDLTARWLFLQGVRTSRLVADPDLDEFIARHRAVPLDDLKTHLVDEGLLTFYQLRKIIDGRPQELVLGQYQIQGELGKGGFGQVYLARHALMGRTVALKVLAEQWAEEPAGREFFLREVAGSTRLNHPHIALPYDAGEADGRVYLAMEHVDGPTLDGYVTARGPLDAASVVAVLRQTAEALKHAAERGVVHRDLKPANLLLAGTPCGGVPFTVKVIDFGLARFVSRDRGPVGTLMCEPGAVVGTPAYMPPEQAADVHDVDIRADLYSLGCTGYFAATARNPFHGRSTQHVIHAVNHSEAVPIEDLQPSTPGWLVAVIRKLMSKRADDRYQTPDDLLLALAAGPQAGAEAWPDLDGLQLAADGPVLPTVVTPVQTPPPAAVLDLRPASEAPTAVALEPAPPPAEEFGPWWQEWHRQVGRLAAGRPPDLQDGEYRVLQRTLLQAVRAAEAGPAADRRPAFLALVEPWVTLKALTALDRRTLADLWAACQRLDAAVKPAHARRSLLKWWR